MRAGLPARPAGAAGVQRLRTLPALQLHGARFSV
uniref:Uncharacterized protein n=1 Tax=Caudovirales sp. ctlwr10 TaxID=2825771 RepID=A0A8S5Q5W3_9CAUD|nr:MAG TPA: hypothetical protein [Caudovirales sp. ctlwr10]